MTNDDYDYEDEDEDEGGKEDGRMTCFLFKLGKVSTTDGHG